MRVAGQGHKPPSPGRQWGRDLGLGLAAADEGPSLAVIEDLALISCKGHNGHSKHSPGFANAGFPVILSPERGRGTCALGTRGLRAGCARRQPARRLRAGPAAQLQPAALEWREGSRLGKAGRGARGGAGRGCGAGLCAHIVDEARVGEDEDDDEEDEEDEDEDVYAPAAASAPASAAMMAAGRTERTLTTTVEFL